MSQVLRVEPAPASARPAAVGAWPVALSAAVPALVGVGFLASAVRADLPAGSAARATLAVLLTQLVPGVLLWRCVRPRQGWWAEDAALGFALGSAVAVAAQVFAALAHAPRLAGVPGVALAVALLAVPATRSRIATATTAPLPRWWAPAVSLTSLVAVQPLLSYYRVVPLRWSSGFRAPHVDTYFHLALVGELAERGPHAFPWVASEPLAYHWFSHAWMAQVASAGGVEPDQVLTRFTPAVMPLVLSFAVAAAALRLTRRPELGLLAAVLCLAGGDLNVFGALTPGYPLTPLSPSVGLSAPALIGIVVVLAMRWRGELGRGWWLVLPMLTLMAAGAKGSTVPLVVAGLVLAALAMAATNRPLFRPVLAGLAVVLGCLAVTVVIVFHGSDAGLHFDPAEAARQAPGRAWLAVNGGRAVAAIAVLSATGVLSRGAGLLGLLVDRAGRADPLTWLLLGAGLAGAAAVALSGHPGSSQWYFARSAGPLLALGSACGIGALSTRLAGPASGARRRAAVVGLVAGPLLAFGPAALFGAVRSPGGLGRAGTLVAAAAVVLAAAAAVVPAGVSRRLVALGTAVVTVLAAGVAVVFATQVRTSLPAPARPVAAAAPLAVSRDQVDAARWIRDHSGIGDLVMTNRHCVTPSAPRHCDSRRYVVAAFSQRQVLVEGWTGVPKATQLAPRGRESLVVDYWKPALLALNDGFLTRPTAAAARALRGLGVRWIFLDATRPHAATLAPLATLRLHTPGVDVYELRR